MLNKEAHEVDKFNALAHEWWNPDGELRTLHHINPIRMQFITNTVALNGKKILDVGCGGGILSESLAKLGADVTAIDLAPQSIITAKLHLFESGLTVNYECIDLRHKVAEKPASYDIVTCLELLEHVDDPQKIIADCANALKPGGIAFFSTLNRNLKSYLLGVLAAEYALKLVPKGTHEYKKFITPAQLRHMLKSAGLGLCSIKGIEYNPWSTKCTLSNDVDINYIVSCIKI
jgi:2-polyprenyl-6-hydroxyphenyl methylase/3-demethylubiquinone-9 3-methyltransferase